MMKILLFHPWIKSKGGAERLIYEYIKRSKHKITVFTWYFAENKSFDFKNVKYFVKYNTLFDKILRTYLSRIILLIFSYIKIPIDKYDIFLISTSGIAELILLRNRNKKTILYVHTPLRAVISHDYLFNLKYRFNKNLFSRYFYKLAFHVYRKLEKIAWKKVDFAIFNSELSLKRALDRKLIDKEKTTIIYPAVDLEGFYNKEPENYILYVARIGMSKRQDILIEAFKEIIKEYPNLKLIFAGSLENKKYYLELLKLIKKYNLEKNVIIKLNLSDKEIKELYAKCLVFVHVPFMEDFGIAPLEAMASGKFVISTIAGNYNILKDAPGIMWIKDSIDKEKVVNNLILAIKEFLKDREKYIKLGLKNREYIKSKDLSWDSFTKKMDELLEILLQKAS